MPVSRKRRPSRPASPPPRLATPRDWVRDIDTAAARLAARQDDHRGRLDLMALIGEAVRAGVRAPKPPVPGAADAFVSIVVCSIDDAKAAAVTAMYERLFAGRPHEIILIRDACSLCEAYGRAARQAKGDVLVFSHDDVEFLTEDFAARLLDHLSRFDLIGFAGTTRLAGPAWIQGGWRFARGQVVSIDKASGHFRVDVYGVSASADGGLEALDGLCFACRREVAERVGFDAESFDGFHLYDTDFTYRAHRAGFRLGVANDIAVLHRSNGRLDAVWQRYAERFIAKFPDRGLSLAFGENPLRAVVFDDRRLITEFLDMVVAVAAAHPGSFAPSAGAGTAQPAAAAGSGTQTSAPLPPARLGMPWTLTELHGWGLVGVHTSLYLVDKSMPPVLLIEPKPSTMRPATRAKLQPLFEDYKQIGDWLAKNPSPKVKVENVDVLHPLGNELIEDPLAARFVGRRNIGVIAFENTKLDAAAIERGKAFDFIIAHSSFNVRLLKEAGFQDVRCALQGIDETDMIRYEQRGSFGNRFVVFSGGKLEFRKGQDLVIEAFRRFHARHHDALLVAAWHNPWPQMSMDVVGSPHIKAPPQIVNGRLQMMRFVVDQGLSPDAFLDLGFLARPHIPAVLAECHAAVFPNRCEGATNLVAMEAMACGVPCVISANTGHLDIIRDGNCYPLTRQTQTPDPNGDRREWGESDIDEAVERLEQIYADRAEAKRRGEAAAAFIRSERTWSKFAEEFVREAMR